jgi:hypothetical protein
MILWIVKKEVLAPTLEQACKRPGRIYAIEEAARDFQPDPPPKPIGFQKKKK